MIDRIAPLTLCEKLILDVLVTHRHLGENYYMFGHSVAQPVRRLVEKEWVATIAPSRKGKLLVTLTDEAVGELMTFDYMPPIAANNPNLQQVFGATIQNAWKLQVKLSRER